MLHLSFSYPEWRREDIRLRSKAFIFFPFT